VRSADPVFRCEPLREIVAHVCARLARGDTEIGFAVLDPDLGRGRHAGELVDHGGERYRHRPLRVWVDLADRLALRLLTPRVDAPLVWLRLERRAPRGLVRRGGAPDPERYGAGTEWARIDKFEEPAFLLDFTEAVARCRIPRGGRVLDLGVNAGDELVALAAMIEEAVLVGVDHSASALAVARSRLPADRVTLVEGDLNALGTMGLGRFDLVVSLNTLQSPGIDDREVMRRLARDHLAPGGAVIIGLPNARYRDGELEYGARIRNLREPELGLLIQDVAYYRRYLHQHGRRVYVTGKYTILVTGVVEPAGPPRAAE
jgi:SAM-dependent methyltransferase